MPSRNTSVLEEGARARQQCPRRKPGATACFLSLRHIRSAFKHLADSQCACQRCEVQFASATEPSSGYEASKSATISLRAWAHSYPSWCTMVKRRERWLARCLTDRLQNHLVWTASATTSPRVDEAACNFTADKKMPITSTSSHASYGHERQSK